MGEDAKRIFADNLRECLNRTGRTQRELAEYMNVSSSTVSDWCAGNKYPRVDKMQRMAEYFSLTMSDLTTKSDNSLPDLNDELIAAYGEVKEHLAEADIADIKKLMRLRAELNRGDK